MASDSKSRDILWQELNAFRNNPAATEEIVKLHQRYYSKRLLFSPDWPAKAISTQEGDTPIWSLIEELKGKTVIGKIMPNESLNLWADELAKAYKKCYEINIPFTAEEGKKVKERLKFSVQHFTKVTCLIGLGFSQKN